MGKSKHGIRIAFFLAVATLISCSIMKNQIGYTGKWNGSDIQGHNFASFENFNGKQDFEIKPGGKNSFYLKYLTNVERGKLHMEIKSSSKSFLSKELSGKVSDSVYIDNMGGEKIKLILAATHADGSFDIKY
jgi:hypothetical protein